MNKKTFILSCVLLALFFGAKSYFDKRQGPAIAPFLQNSISVFQKNSSSLPEEWDVSGICIFPEAHRKPWLDAIGQAKKSLRLAAYRLSDPEVIKALVTAAGKGIDVTLLVEPDFEKNERSENIASPLDVLKAHNKIKVHHLSKKFKQSHHKVIIVDEQWAMVSSGNLDAESFDGINKPAENLIEKPARDFSITVTEPEMVKEIITVFDADIKDEAVTPSHPQLVWGPDTQRKTFLTMIRSAKKTIHIYQQSIQDEEIAKALAEAAKKGVKVELLMIPFPFNKKADYNVPNQDLIRKAGGVVHLCNHLYIHAKAMVIDEEVMYIGSCNCYAPSLDETRELGVITNDKTQITKVLSVFEADKQQAGLK